MEELQAFTLLKNVLAEARGLALHHFMHFSDPLSAFDSGIRTHLADSNALYEQLRATIVTLAPNTVVCLHDSLRLNYVLFRGHPNSEDFYSIGPFRPLPFDENEYVQLKQENGLSLSHVSELQAMLQIVPCNIGRMEALAIARNLLLTLHGCDDPQMQELTLQSKQEQSPRLIPLEDINVRIKRVEETYLHETKLLAFISEGNYAKAMREAEYFSQSNLSRKNSINFQTTLRSYLYAANTGFRKAAQAEGVHPYHLDEISQKFASKLSLCVTTQQLNAVMPEMVEAYCRLCREYPNRKYSANVQKITNYILFNLSDDLTPDSIATAVNFSPNYISRKIKEEVGLPLMGYIAQQRVRVAKRLLKESPMSVREISQYVGIDDWNYFTKIFKKITDCTPSEYRKKETEI